MKDHQDKTNKKSTQWNLLWEVEALDTKHILPGYEIDLPFRFSLPPLPSLSQPLVPFSSTKLSTK